MSPKKFGRRGMIVDSAKAATIMRLDTTSAQATTHNALSLGATVEGIFDISPGQTLSSDTAVARGDIIIADSTPKWARLAHPGIARHLQTDATDVAWAQNITMGASAWVGLGAAAGRVEFDDTTVDEFNILAANVGINTSTPGRRLHVVDSSGSTMRLEYNATNYANLDIGAGGNLTVAPTGDFIFDPTGNDILPLTAYDLNIGQIFKKYKTLHCAELWVETLVAQETIATIGGRILVGPTTLLSEPVAPADTSITVKHNQMASGDIVYLESQGKVEFMTIDSPPSLLGNPISLNFDFETVTGNDFYGWTENVSDGALEDSAISFSGSHAVKLTAGSLISTWIAQNSTVNPGERYILRIYTRGDGTYAGRYQVWDNTNSQNIIETTSTGITAAAYSYVDRQFVAPDGCVNVVIFLRCPSTNGGVCYFDLTTLRPTRWSHNVTRNLDGTGANYWWQGDAVFNTGTTGDGFIDLYSLYGVNASGNTAGPTIVGNVRSSTTYNDWSEHWAIGNLNGLYGYAAASYGVGLGRYADGYSHLTIDDGNGVRFFTDTDTVDAQLSGSVWTLGRTTNEHVQIETSALKFMDAGTNVGIWTGSYFRVGRSASANVHISNANGVRIREGAVVKGEWQPDGDIFIGSDISNAASTYFSVFATAQTYNSESVGAGDMLIGDNSASKANIFWDQSTAKLLFRGGTASAVGIDTDGQIEAAKGNVLLSEDGIVFADNARYMNFYESIGGSLTGQIGITYEGGRRVAVIYSVEPGGGDTYDPQVLLTTKNSTAVQSYAQLDPTHLSVYAGGANIADLRVEGGLYVGDTGTDPDDNDIWCDGELSTNGGTTRFKLGAHVGTTDTATGHIPITINGTEYRVLAYAAP